MEPKGSVYEGKTLDDAVRKGLEALRLSRAEVMITVVEEGSGGFLGLGARPYKVRMMPRPGGAPREPDERGGTAHRRERSERGGRGRSERSGERAGRGRRDAQPARGEGRGETRPADARPAEARPEGGRGRDGSRRRDDRRTPDPNRAPAEGRGRGEGRRDEVRSEGRRDEVRSEGRRDEVRSEGRRDEVRSEGRRDEVRGEGRRDEARPEPARREEGRGRGRGRDAGRSEGGRDAGRPEAGMDAGRSELARDREPSRAEARPREVEREREPEMAEAGEGGSDAATFDRGEDRGRRRRRRGRRGRGEGGVEREPSAGRQVVGETVSPVGIAEPEMQSEPRDVFQDEPREELHQDRIARLRQIGPGNRQPLDRDRGPRETRERAPREAEEREPREAREREPRERDDSDREPLMSSDQLATLGRQATDDLLKAMGFVGTVTAKADGSNVDVTAEVPDGEDLLTGRKGEVRQALQHLLNRMINRGEGTRYHLQLEVNDFWQRREDELVGIAKGLADEAVASQGEVFTEYLNSQERRIIHVTLREDARVKTYAIGEGMIKKVAIAPADFAEDTRSDE